MTEREPKDAGTVAQYHKDLCLEEVQRNFV